MERRRFLELVGLSALPLATSACSSTTLLSQSIGTPSPKRVRLRQLGITIGSLAPGPYNAITDVDGVQVGHITLIEGKGPLVIGKGPVRTGITAILPHAGNLSRQQLLAADFTLNGNGELTGLGPIRRTGRLGAPILLTNTSSVGAAYDGAMGYLLEQTPELFSLAVPPEPVVGETWADSLNDTAGDHIRPEHARQAIAAAHSGPVAEGCVGGGTGMRAYKFKAGIGTASRQVPCTKASYTVGVLVQANHGLRSQLLVNGVPVGKEIPELQPEYGKQKSLLVVIATDAPLLPIQLQRLCKRATLGMARTGAISTHGSGDLLLAFSTAQRLDTAPLHDLAMLKNSHITDLHQAVVEATEEAILNALTMAHTMTGRDGNTIHALPLDRLVEIMRQYGRLE